MNEEGKYPSLDLAFEWLKDVLEEQSLDADSLAGRAVMVFSVSTAVVGFAVPLALSLYQTKVSSVFLTALVVVYVALSLLTGFAVFLRGFPTLRHPTKIREEFWRLEPWVFKQQILAHMEDSFEQNQRKLVWRVFAVQGVVLLSAIETVFVVLLLRFPVS